MLVDILTEGRVLVALVREPAVLAAAEALELDDFADLRHQAVFTAIRELQARAMLVVPFEIDAWIRRHDAELGTSLAEKAGLAFIVELELDYEPYGHAVLWEHDMRWLRTLALRRAVAIAQGEAA